MAATPPWLLGRHATSCIGRAVAVDSVGELSVVAGNYALVGAPPIAGVLDGIETQRNTNTEVINNLVSGNENNVPILEDDTFIFSEIMLAGALADFSTNQSMLPRLWNSGYDYAVFTFVLGGNTYEFYGLMTDYSEEITLERCTCRLELKQLDLTDGSANPAYAEA
jgi:hypothetical protein